MSDTSCQVTTLCEVGTYTSDKIDRLLIMTRTTEDVIRLHWKGNQKNLVLPLCQSNHLVILDTDFLL